MKKKEIKGAADKDLKTMLTEKRKKLADFRFNIVGGKIKNVKEGRVLRKEIAQVLTELNRTK